MSVQFRLPMLSILGTDDDDDDDDNDARSFNDRHGKGNVFANCAGRKGVASGPAPPLPLLLLSPLRTIDGKD
eukprot:scaffold12639_cov16-Tisochrysis_lutea.AAC.1